MSAIMYYVISNHTYELFCGLICSSVNSHRAESTLTPFPTYFMKESKKDFEYLKQVLEYMPSINDLFKLKNKIEFFVNDDNELIEQIENLIKNNYWDKLKIKPKIVTLKDIVYLFEFILKKQQNKKFSVHLISYQEYLKNNEKLLLKPDFIFKLKYNNNNFNEENEEITTGFHGSSIENIYSILINSLQNYSDTIHMRTGNVFGSGIYLCEDVRVARDFSKGGMKGFNKSKLMGSKLSSLVQCSVIKKPEYLLSSTKDKHRYLIVKKSEHVRIDYLFVYSSSKNEEINSQHFSKRLILFYILLLMLLIIYNYWTSIKREIKKLMK
ncbi:hypothetical protein ABK040_010006 [Willaertia magna]